MKITSSSRPNEQGKVEQLLLKLAKGYATFQQASHDREGKHGVRYSHQKLQRWYSETLYLVQRVSSMMEKTTATMEGSKQSIRFRADLKLGGGRFSDS